MKWLAVLLLLSVGATCLAAESPNDNVAAVEAYVARLGELNRYSADRDTLKTFGGLLREYRGLRRDRIKRLGEVLKDDEWDVGARGWKEHCDKVNELLGKMRTFAQQVLMELPGVKAVDLMADWATVHGCLRHETAQWQAIQRLGTEMVTFHHDLAKLATTVRAATWTLSKTRDRIVLLSRTADQAGLFAWKTSTNGNATLDLVNQALRMLSQQDVHGPIELVTSIYRLEAPEVEDLMRSANYRGYKSRFEKLKEQKLDLDEQGFYLQHEKAWESYLRADVDEFQNVYDKYTRVAKPFLKEGFRSSMEYFRNVSVMEWVSHMNALEQGLELTRKKLGG